MVTEIIHWYNRRSKTLDVIIFRYLVWNLYSRLTITTNMIFICEYEEIEINIAVRITEFFGLFATSGVLGTRKHNVSETGSFSVLRCKGKTPTQLGPLYRANLNLWAFSDWEPQILHGNIRLPLIKTCETAESNIRGVQPWIEGPLQLMEKN
jgi:hypothetical protein